MLSGILEGGESRRVGIVVCAANGMKAVKWQECC
jgi:hypothetical protein